MKTEQGNSASIISFEGKTPEIHSSVFLCEGVRIIGDVRIGRDSSVWFNTVIRGDVNYIRIGEQCNIQDNSMLHVTHDTHPLNIGNRVSIAHSVSLHGCTLEDECLVGIGGIVLDGARIGKGALVAAGALVRENFEVPPNTLVAGVPAKVIRNLKSEEIQRISETPDNYRNYVKRYKNI